jgi:hypothetical protein
VSVKSNAYRADGPWSLDVAAGATGTLHWNLEDSGHWYDFTVSGDNFERRFSGRVETGKPGVSDPAMALHLKAVNAFNDNTMKQQARNARRSPARAGRRARLGHGPHARGHAQTITWDPAKSNLGIGTGTGTTGVTGTNNQALGTNTGNNVSTNYNLAIGDGAGSNVSGDNANQAIGYQAGVNVVGGWNQSFGRSAGDNVTGNHNNAMGFHRLRTTTRPASCRQHRQGLGQQRHRAPTPA